MKQIFEYVTTFVAFVLILAGIGGVAFNMFKEGGWLGAILGKVWDVQMEHPLVAIPFTIVVLVIGKLWYDHNRAKGHTSKLPDVIIYVIMAAGVYFIYQLVINGTF